MMSLSPYLFPRQAIDPFYLQTFEKGRKAFISGDYPQALKEFEVAAFGCAADSRLRAQALVYLGLSQFYLTDLKTCEKSLREAAGLLKDQDWSGLDIVEQARPDLKRLWEYFGLQPSPQGTSPKASKPQTNSDPSPPPAALLTDVPPKGDAEVDRISRLKLGQVKEGDEVPLELTETPPETIKKVPAVYPAWARTTGLEPRVKVNALVSEKGQVIQTQILEGAKHAAGFNQAAEQAVRRWKFRPATVKGIRVRVWIPISVEFKANSPD